MAAMFGGIPIAIGSGNGSELRRPLGITIVGGLIVSQMLTLYTTPVIYLYMDRLQASEYAEPAKYPNKIPASAREIIRQCLAPLGRSRYSHAGCRALARDSDFDALPQRAMIDV